jgi:hypothetical protein
MDRRPVLKALGVSAALVGLLPQSWSRPIVQPVVTPAHAATSAPVTSTTATTLPPPTTIPAQPTLSCA